MVQTDQAYLLHLACRQLPRFGVRKRERTGHGIIRVLRLHCCIERSKEIAHGFSLRLRCTFAYFRITSQCSKVTLDSFFAQAGIGSTVKLFSDLPSPFSYLLGDHNNRCVSRYIYKNVQSFSRVCLRLNLLIIKNYT